MKIKIILSIILLMTFGNCLFLQGQGLKFEVRYNGEIVKNGQIIEISDYEVADGKILMKFQPEVINISSATFDMRLVREAKDVQTATLNKVCWDECPKPEVDEARAYDVRPNDVERPYGEIELNHNGEAQKGTSIVYYTFQTESKQDKKLKVEVHYIYDGIPPFSKENGVVTLKGYWMNSDFMDVNLSDPSLVELNLKECRLNEDAVLPAIANPNLLIHVSENMQVPASWKNVVKGAQADQITLTDGFAFRNTKEFTVGTITYIREYPHVGFGSLCLPFDVTEIPTGLTAESFSSSVGTIVTFVAESAMNANTPYLVEITAAGKKEFVARNVTVPVTSSQKIIKGNYSFEGTFQPMAGNEAAGLYILNHDGKGFRKATSSNDITAFRSYMRFTDSTGAPATGTLRIDHASATGMIERVDSDRLIVTYSDGSVHVTVPLSRWVEVYSLNGTVIDRIYLQAGVNRLALDSGIYVMEGQKIVVK